MPGYLRTADFARHEQSRARGHPPLRPRAPSRSRLLFRRTRFPRLRAELLRAWACGASVVRDQAQRMAWQCIDDARALGHAFSLAHGLNMGSLTFLLLNDVDACRAVADELYPFAERNKFPWPLAQAPFLRGWLAAQQGDRDAGIEQMRQAVDRCRPRPFCGRSCSRSSPSSRCAPARFADAIATLDQAADELRAGTPAFTSRRSSGRAARSCWRNRATMPPQPRRPSGGRWRSRPKQSLAHTRTARRDQPGAAASRWRAQRRSPRAAGADLRHVHRRFRQARICRRPRRCSPG